jgi:hypothetical protein
MNRLVRYDAAKRAIAEYRTVDEVKDFRDKALAIEAYAKQANDFDLEYDAAVARVRAERKCGELLAETEKAKAGRPPINRSNQTTNLESPKTLAEMGVTKDQSSKWQKLAAIPEKEFEAAVSIPGSKPSTNHLIKTETEHKPRMDKDALWFWGLLRDMRSRNIFDKSPETLVAEWTDSMKDDAESVIPKLKKWVNSYE